MTGLTMRLAEECGQDGIDGPRVRDAEWRKRRVRRLERDVSVVERTSSWINVAVWGVAAGVMAYGAVNVTPLLIEHGVLRWAAPGLPLMVDLAMCIGLWGDRIMHQYGRKAGWVTVLRWITAAMTLLLNVSGPVLGLDWVGLGIHACGPLLILVVAEAAGAFQRIFAEIISDLYTEIDRQCAAPAADRGADRPQAAESAVMTSDAAVGSLNVVAGLGPCSAATERDESRGPAVPSRLVTTSRASGTVSRDENEPVSRDESPPQRHTSPTDSAGQASVSLSRDASGVLSREPSVGGREGQPPPTRRRGSGAKGQGQPGIAYPLIRDAPLARFALVWRTAAGTDLIRTFASVVTELGPIVL